jgi:hypothetical protein
MEPELSAISEVATGEKVTIHGPISYNPTATKAIDVSLEGARCVPSPNPSPIVPVVIDSTERPAQPPIQGSTALPGLVGAILSLRYAGNCPPSAGLFQSFPLASMAADTLDEPRATRVDTDDDSVLASTTPVGHPGLPSFQTTRDVCRSFLTRHMQSHQCVSDQEIDRDVRRVYSPEGLVNPKFAASRFRCFMILYLLGHPQQAPDEGNFQRSYRSAALDELGHVLASENLVSSHQVGGQNRADDDYPKTCVQALTLLSLMAMREPQGPSFWQLVGLAVRTAIALDLHRRDDIYLGRHAFIGSDEAVLASLNEQRKNVFWAVYNLDRLGVYMFGRPPAIRDEDIDVDVSPTGNQYSLGHGVDVHSFLGPLPSPSLCPSRTRPYSATV